MSKRAGDQLWTTIAYLVIILVVIFSIAPILWTIITSLKPETDIVTSVYCGGFSGTNQAGDKRG